MAVAQNQGGNNSRGNNATQSGSRRVQQGGNNNQNGSDWEKADAFLNIALPTAKGEKVRLDSIKLKASNPVHKQLIDRLSAPDLTPEQQAEKLKSLVSLFQIEFTVPRSDEDKELVEF